MAGRQQQEEELIILTILRFLFKVLTILLSLIVLPVALVVRLTNYAITDKEGLYHKCIAQSVRSYMYVYWLARFLSVCLCGGVIAGQIEATGWAMNKYLLDSSSPSWLWPALTFGYLFIFATGLNVVGKLIKPLEIDRGEYVKGVFWSIVDIATCFVCLFVTCCVVRAGHLCDIDNKLKGEHRKEWRTFVLKQVLMTAVDIALLPLVLLLIVFPWRLTTVYHTWHKLADDETEQRMMLFTQAIKVLLDLPFLFLLLISLPFMPHRFVCAVRDICGLVSHYNKQASVQDATMSCRGVVVTQFLRGLLDPLVFIARLVLLVTHYRHARTGERLKETGGFFMRPIELVAEPKHLRRAE
jgi:hypothetical protein